MKCVFKLGSFKTQASSISFRAESNYSRSSISLHIKDFYNIRNFTKKKKINSCINSYVIIKKKLKENKFLRSGFKIKNNNNKTDFGNRFFVSKTAKPVLSL
jgi:hypothetical protein